MAAPPTPAAAPAGTGIVDGGAGEPPKRRLLTKRGWLGRPIQRWCEVNHDELVYYASRESEEPKGRIALRGCRLGSAGAAGAESVLDDDAGRVPSQPSRSSSVRLLRPGKSACEIHGASQRDADAIFAALHTALLAPASPPISPALATAARPPSSASEAAGSPLSSASAGEAAAQEMQARLPSRSAEEATQELLALGGRLPRHGGDSAEEAPDDLMDEGVDDSEDINDVDELCAAAALAAAEAAAGGGPAKRADANAAALAVSGFSAAGDGSTTAVDTTPRPSSQSSYSGAAAGAANGAPRDMGAEGPPSSSSSSPSPKEVYRQALDAMWRYDLESAERLLEPWRRSSVWHAAAFAECALLRVAINGRLSEAHGALERVRAAESMLEGQSGAGSGGDGGGSTAAMSLQVVAAELLLFRSALNVMLGSRLRALFNLRQSWQLFKRLERRAPAPAAPSAGAAGAGGYASAEEGRGGGADCALDPADLRGRVCFGAGFFYLATSLLPLGLSPLLRLAGFVVNRELGKALLAEASELGLGSRGIPAAISLAMYHLDIEPNMPRAGELLVGSLGRTPENVLLHWAGSVFAWRNACHAQAIEMVSKAIWCCGATLGKEALFLRYELGLLHLIGMNTGEAYPQLRYVYDTMRSERVCFPYRVIVSTHLASACFGEGREEEGLLVCREAERGSDWSLKVEGECLKLMQLFAEKRQRCRKLMAFEVAYLLRQFPKIPQELLLEVRARARALVAPFAEEALRMPCAASFGAGAGASPSPARRPTEEEAAVLVEWASGQVIEAVACFYLGAPEDAMPFVPQLASLCVLLPSWSAYISAHGLYWCGRMCALSGRREEAQKHLRQARSYKKYPFFIGEKISTVLAELDRRPSTTSAPPSSS